MGAFKQFTTKEVTITPFNADKGFSFSGGAITGSNVGIEVYTGIKPATNLFISSAAQPTGLVYFQNTTGVYNSTKQLYYSNYLSSPLGDDFPTRSLVAGATPEDDRYVGITTGPRFDNYLQTDLTQSRYWPTQSGAEISVVSIPAKLYGENIVPTTFQLSYTASGGDEYLITDDGEGNLISGSQVCGQIFYGHGIAAFTTSSIVGMGAEVSESVSNLNNLDISFTSSIRIYEHQYRCGIRENEFGYSLNPTLLSGSLDDVYYDFVTGSYFTPYVTSVGLYNENNDLLVVGKLSQPVPISQYIDTTIVVNFDL